MFSIKLSQTIFKSFPDCGKLHQAGQRRTSLVKLTLVLVRYDYCVAKYPLPGHERRELE